MAKSRKLGADISDDEQVFLDEVRKDPADESARLIYADWLEEQGDPRAEYLRAESAFQAFPPIDQDRARAGLYEMQAEIDSHWLASIARTSIENCPLEFEFRCPKQWEELQVLDSPDERYCSTCEQNVYYCSTVGVARHCARNGQCVAVNVALVRGDRDLQDPPERILRGRIRVSDRPRET